MDSLAVAAVEPAAASPVATPARADAPKLLVRGVSKSFERRGERVLALDRIDLSVSAGEFVTIVGPSGCGKSTLLMIAAGLESPSEGQVFVDGRPAGPPGADRAVVFQRFALFPAMTVERNIEFGLSVAGVPADERARRVAAQLELMGLGGFGRAYPHELSGGMQQRAAIARALILEPAILLMDEPFGALDAQMRTLLQDEVARIARRLALTVLFITHSVSEAVYLGHRVVVMTARPGRLKEIVAVPRAAAERWASADEALEDDEFARLHNHVWARVKEEIHAG